MDKILIVIAIVGFTGVASLVFRFLNVGFEKQTKELCAIYAEKDHSKEIAETRRQWLLENGYDYNNDFDWYESCIKHSSNY